MSDSRESHKTETVNVYEYDVSGYRVFWRAPDGEMRRSQTCSTYGEAVERSARHDWPYAIVQERRSIEVVDG